MQPRRTAALSRHTAPSFVLIGGLELMQLRKLSWLARCVFFELRAMADHSTGRVSTSYAVLSALLDFDQAPQAHTTPGATQKRLRTALADLAALGLVRIDPIKNEKAKGLFLKLQPAQGLTAPADMKGRQKGRPQESESQGLARVSGRSRPDVGQTEGQGVQENTSPPTPSLSTTRTGPPPAVAEHMAKVRAALTRAGGETRAPKGARTSRG